MKIVHGSMVELDEVDVGQIGGKTFAHGNACGLKEMLIVKFEVIVVEGYVK